MPQDDLLTTAQVAEETGWSINTVLRWAAAGDLPYAHKSPGKSGAYLFRRTDIEQRIRPRGGLIPTGSTAA